MKKVSDEATTIELFEEIRAKSLSINRLLDGIEEDALVDGPALILLGAMAMAATEVSLDNAKKAAGLLLELAYEPKS